MKLYLEVYKKSKTKAVAKLLDCAKECLKFQASYEIKTMQKMHSILSSQASDIKIEHKVKEFGLQVNYHKPIPEAGLKESITIVCGAAEAATAEIKWKNK